MENLISQNVVDGIDIIDIGIGNADIVGNIDIDDNVDIDTVDNLYSPVIGGPFDWWRDMDGINLLDAC